MAYTLRFAEKDVLGKDKFKNAKGRTECVEFVRQAAGAPQTLLWKRGKKVSEAKVGEIARTTAIATFDDQGRYPTDSQGKHAAIYLSHDKNRIVVLDQWDDTEPARDRLPMSFFEVYLGEVTREDFRKNSRSELGTRTATLHKEGIEKLRKNWIYMLNE